MKLWGGAGAVVMRTRSPGGRSRVLFPSQLTGKGDRKPFPIDPVISLELVLVQKQQMPSL